MTEVQDNNNTTVEGQTTPATPANPGDAVNKKKETIIRRNRPGSKAEVCTIF